MILEYCFINPHTQKEEEFIYEIDDNELKDYLKDDAFIAYVENIKKEKGEK